MADNKQLNPREDSENEGLIDMVDEDGNHEFFEHIATLEYEGETYLALAEPGAVDSAEDSDESLEIIILRIDQNEKGEDIYVTPDEETAQAVLEDLLTQIEEMGDEEE